MGNDAELAATSATVELKRAEASLRKAILLNALDATAHYELGGVLVRMRRLEEALASYDVAIEINTTLYETHQKQARSLRSPMRSSKAPESDTETSALKPALAKGYLSQGLVLQMLHRREEAVLSYDEAIGLKADYAEAYFHRGNALADLKRPAEALRSYDQAIRLSPGVSTSYYNRANTLRSLGRFQEALSDYNHAIALRPGYASAYNNRGTAQLALGQPENALASFDRAIELAPKLAEAFYNRANALRDCLRLDEALVSYQRATELHPHYADAFNNMGGVLADLMRLEKALEAYERATQLAPQAPASWVNCGNVLKDQGRLDEALASYQQALTLQPHRDFLYGTWLHTKMRLCNWQGAESDILELSNRVMRGEKAAPPFSVVTLVDSEAIQRMAAEIWVADRYSGSATTFPGRRQEHGRIRLGYYSSDYRDHATTFLMAGLFEQHDRSKFELFGFSFGPGRNDTMRRRVSAAFDRFIDVRDRTDEGVVNLSRQLGIDIAIDLKGFTQGHRAGIFARRAAPIQVSYLGYPGTTGSSYMDYLIADRATIPVDRQGGYSEKIAYVPYSYQVNDRSRVIGQERLTRQAVGLPETGTVYCCFNNNYKIVPGMFDRWMRVLEQVDGSVLWLLEDNQTAASNLRKEAGDRGVDPGRLIFAKRVAPEDHLARHRLADLFLDTLPCNAHTTASDALWAGLPLLTCVGHSFAGRVAASLLSAIQLPELITTSLSQYEQLAIELGTDTVRLLQIKRKLEDNRLATPLFDTAQSARYLEALYEQMYERYLTNDAPEHLFS